MCGYLQSKNPNKQYIFTTITDVITAFINTHYKDIGFSNDTLDMVIFLLCFCSPPKAWLLL